MKSKLTFLISLFSIYSVGFGKTEFTDIKIEIKPCVETVAYSVDDIKLKAHFGKNLLKPNVNPSFKGDLDVLKKYFASKALADERAKDIVFRVHIGFLVNCQGQEGNFQIVSKGKGHLQDLAQQVLAEVQNMPHNWQPASVDNKLVDSYQILSFTVAGGVLDNVTYR